LDEFLRDPLGLEKFHQFLEGEFSTENLDFWLLCESYKQRVREGGDDVGEKAKEIINEFFLPGAPSELNVKHKQKESVFERIEKCQFDESLFEDCQHDIYELMATDSFPRFIKTDLFTEFVRERHPEWIP